MADLLDRLAELSPEKRRMLEMRLKLARRQTADAELVARARPDGTAPTSFAQQRLWLLDRMDPGNAGWNVPTPLRLRGALHVPALERALNAMRERHESLRTTFAERAGGPVQVIHPHAPVPLPVLDLTHLPEGERAAETRRLVDADANQGFDLERGPLLRASLLRLAPDEHVLRLVKHHAVSDGWSSGIFFRELSALYAAFQRGGQAADADLAPLPLQYADYAAWQREHLSGERLEQALAYWKQRLAGAPPALDLPTDRPRDREVRRRGSRVPITLPPPLLDALRALALAENTTLFSVLLAALRVVIWRWSGERDAVVGTVSAGRARLEVEGLIGFFVNTLALRTPLDAGMTFAELLRAERGTVLDAFAHQEVPFERVVEALSLPRDPARHPVFQVMISLQNTPGGGIDMPGVTVAQEPLAFESARMDLAFDCHELADGLSIFADYDTALFDADTVRRFCAHLHRVLEQGAAVPSTRLDRFALLDQAERADAVLAGPPAAAEAEPVHVAIARAAAVSPDAVAVVDADGARLTRAELEARASAVAAALAARGVGRGGRVAVCLERGVDLPAALLGVLKAGAAYVPVDPSYPAERIRWMLEDSAAAVILTSSRIAERLPSVDTARLLVEEIAASGDDGSFASPEVDPDELAYVIYTSGSTGRPKGAAIPHRALAAHMAWMQQAHPLAADDRVLQKTPVSFDASVWEFWAPLLAGATLVMAGPDAHREPAKLAREVAEREITVVQLVPALLRAVLDEPAVAEWSALRRLFVGGEAFPRELARRAAAALPAVRIVNLYGPAEACIDATAHVFSAAADEPVVVLGRPISGMRAYVLDERLEPAPTGVPGELYLSGDGLGRGYLHRAGMTAERWLPDPFPGRAGRRMYRTGDRARRRADGTLEYLGRADAQVKVNGVRLEPGEVEAALTAVSGVREAAVAVREDAPGRSRLVGYVVPSNGALSPAALRDALRAVLPDALVPAAFVTLDALPRTPGGKLDRRALPSPEPAPADAFVAPATVEEQALAAVWGEVLTAERVGATDDFFARGGHSLLAAQVTARVRDWLGVDLPLRDVFDAPVLRDLARRLAALRPEPGAALPPRPAKPSADTGESRASSASAEAGTPAAGDTAQIASPASSTSSASPRSALAPIPRADRSGPLPLSFAQERMWFIDQLDPGSHAYNVPFALDITGALDVDVLARAVGEIVRRHEALRSVYAQGPDGVVQRILPAGDFPLPVIDLTHLPEEEREEAAKREMDAEVLHGFDLAAGPMLRGHVLRLGEQKWLLVMVMHHVVSDAWSMGIFFRELTTLYDAFAAGRPSPLPELPVQYADFAAWQRERLKGDGLEKQAAYWRARLAGVPPMLELPTDRPRPPVQDLRGAGQMFELPMELVRAARETAQREGATLFMVLLAAFTAVLHRWSGEEDVVVGTPMANRPHTDLERLIGFFNNTLALRADLSGDPTFRELLRRVRETTLGAYARQDVPFEKLVDEIRAERSLSHTPVFQVMFTLQNTPSGGALEMGGLEMQSRTAALDTSRFDLTMIVGQDDEDGRLLAWVEYATALFDAATIIRLQQHFEAVLRGASARPETHLSMLPLLPPQERAQVVEAFNATAASVDGDARVHDLVARQAARTPHAVAVEMGDARLSYAELEARANRLARRLIALGVRPDARVAVAMERSPEMVVAVLAVLRAGGGYVAVDPAYPPERIAYMLEDSRAAVVLTTTSVAARLPETAAPLFRVDAEEAETARESADDPRVAVDPENLCYVLYTSGSTGRPKGAALPHRALVALLEWQARRFGSAPPARTLQFASLSFDVSFQEIFSTWATGGTLVLVDDETRRDGEALLRRLRESAIERLFLPFAALQNLAETAELSHARLPALREVITAGEALRSTPPLRAFFRAHPGCTLDNQYGPSETHVISAQRLPGDVDAWPALPPIGAPVENTRLYVLDARMQPAPVGVPGELWAGGASLGRGYLGRPELTAEKFAPDPFGPAGGRLYRTGDRCRWRPDGTLEYLGRMDFQVKVRGFRVEPGEIEAVLTEHPAVAQAAVAVRGEGNARRLAAYVVPFAGASPSIPDLRAHVGATLPEYMVPASWAFLAALPLTPSGKVDRRSLPDADLAAGTVHVPPRNAAERMVADIWAQVLGVNPSVTDNFFDLGGHSLRATQVVARVRRAFGVDLALRELFESPTVAGLAERVQAAPKSAEAQAAPIAAVERTRATPLSFAQQRFWFIEQMGSAGTVYNMPFQARLHGPLDPAALEAALNGIVERHESLRTTFAFHEQPVQEVAAHLHLPLTVVDLTKLGDDAREREAERLADNHARAPFDLSAGPLIRAELLKLAEDEHLLLLNLHHIVCDGWSLGVLYRELGELYAAQVEQRPHRLPPLPIQYPDFALWQRRRLDGAALDQELAWWKARLEHVETLALPTDRPAPATQSFRGAMVPFEFPAQVARGVETLARAENATQFMVLLAAFQVLLSRWSGSEDVVVGSPVAGRVPEETEALIGVFVNTLALRTDLSGDPTFRQALARVREGVMDAYAHQDVPFERLVEELKVERSLGRHPIFQVLFSMHTDGAEPPAFPGVTAELGEGDTGTTKFDLMLAIGSGEQGMGGAIQYATDLFDAQTVERMAGHLGTLLAAATADPDARISALPLLDAAEAARVLEDFNRTEAAHPRGLAIHQLFEAQVARAPHEPALWWQGETLTYGELNARANRLAHRLRRLGVGPESRVAVCMERTPALIVSIFAVLKAGGAYVPVDPAYPADRIAFMLRDSRAPVVLTSAALAPTLPASDAVVVAVDVETAPGDAEPDTSPSVAVDERNLAYVIYTSGSTGTPKGVQVEHRSTVAFLHWMREHVTDAERRSVLASTSVSFDVHVAEIFGTLSWGGRIVLVKNALSLAELTEPVVLASMAPSAAAELLRSGGIPSFVRRLNLGGEALPASLAQGLYALGTVRHVGNYYGPTEDTTYSTSWRVERGAERVFVGRPVANTRAYVLDRHFAAVPVGVPGELWLAGAGLSRGYHDRPALTADRFRPDPYTREPGGRMYRVGDLVRFRTDGVLDYLGRLDFQVKLRGHRVETGEIEAVLSRHPAVRQAAVAARGSGVHQRLIAWVVPAGEPVPVAELRAWLRSRVPEYMLPSAYMNLPELPLNPNGKVDRPRLPDPAPERAADGAPRSAMERRVAKVWEEVLEVKAVGVDDNFFEIGGHSLLLARLQERLRAELGRDVPVVELFQFSTVRALAAHLDPRPGDDASADAAPEGAAAGQDRAARRREMMRRGRR